MPPNTVYVGRPTRWGNPYVVGNTGIKDSEDAVFAFEEMLKYGSDEIYPMEDKIIDELRGKNLACWCPLDQPCHADVLLRIANQEVEK